MIRRPLVLVVAASFALLLVPRSPLAGAEEKKQKKDSKSDPFAELVWPPPPDKARIKLDAIITGRLDVEAESTWAKLLAGSSASQWDKLEKPHDVEFDSKGRLLVSDPGSAAVLRFDRAGRKMDVFGTSGVARLKTPLGIGVGPDDSFWVADAGERVVVGFEKDGKLLGTLGRGELTNPTDAAVSPDGKRIYVTDSKSGVVVVYDPKTLKKTSSFGKPGAGPGEFWFPSSVTVAADGRVFVVDQMNARVQIFTSEGGFLDTFGERGRVPGTFSRPKDVGVDEAGLIYVTDFEAGNVQIFDVDLSLLTFVGSSGAGPGQFQGASGVAVRQNEFALVDQVGGRIQIFRWIGPKTGE